MTPTEPPPVVSVIVPARNAAATIAEQLDALAAQTFTQPWELLVADNGSTDNTVEIALGHSDRFESLRVVEASQRAGSAHARNEAARHARAGVLCFCDSDDIVAPGWLEALTRCLTDHDVVAGRLDMTALNDERSRAWRPKPEAAKLNPQLSFAPSGNMAIRASTFAALGGFDVEYPKSHDVEFGHRLRAAGHSIGFCPDAVVAYRLRSDLRGLANQAYRAGRATAQACADGHVPPRSWSATVRDWLWLLVRIPTIVAPVRRGIWVRRSAEAAGRVTGSIRRRVRYL